MHHQEYSNEFQERQQRLREHGIRIHDEQRQIVFEEFVRRVIEEATNKVSNDRHRRAYF
jgi:hypothetical protein